MMNLNFEEKKSSFKLLAILLLVYSGINILLMMLIPGSLLLNWIYYLCFGTMGIILLVKDIEKKYIAIPLGIVTLIHAYFLFRGFSYSYCGVYVLSSLLELAAIAIITFYAVNLWKKIEVPFLFKYWYLPAICVAAAVVIEFIGGFLCRIFY